MYKIFFNIVFNVTFISIFKWTFANCKISRSRFLTIGQYLQPSTKHHPLERYYTPDEFEELKTIAQSKGFLLVSSSPLTRSSYHADEDFAVLQKK